jgi:hypothetical protein
LGLARVSWASVVSGRWHVDGRSGVNDWWWLVDLLLLEESVMLLVILLLLLKIHSVLVLQFPLMIKELLLLLKMSCMFLIKILLMFLLLLLNHLLLLLIVLLFACILIMGNVSFILHSLFLELLHDFVFESVHVLRDSLLDFLVNEVSYALSHVVGHML